MYKILLLKKNIAEELESYDEYADEMRNQESTRLLESVYLALESIADIDDNRALYY